MERVLVIGSPAAGKSTFTTELARRTGLPIIHLDKEHWQPGWVEMDKAAWAERVKQLVARDRWVMDGNYGGTLAIRLERADTVILLDYPVWLCLARVLRRIFTTRGRVRPDMGEGCPERLDFEFLLYIAMFRRGPGRRNERKLKAYGGRLIRLRSQADADRYLASVARSG